MSFQKFKSNSFCVGGRNRAVVTKTCGDITSKGSRAINGYCSVCRRNNSRTVSDNTKQAVVLRDFFAILDKKGLGVSKKMAKNVSKFPGRALDIGANVGSAIDSRSRKAALSSLR